MDIYNNTIDICLSNLSSKLKLSKSLKYDISYLKDYTFSNTFNNTQIMIYNNDTIDVAIHIHDLYPESKLLIMNLASYTTFGGGVKKGCMAQEEELFRKTDYALHEGQHLYPLNKKEFVFTEDVLIVNDSNYDLLPQEDMFYVDFLAIAAIKNPKLINDALTSYDYHITYNKIKSFFLFAIKHKYIDVIVGAFGCGVYNNPPIEIIEIYNDCIKKYKKSFRSITFAILSKNDNNFKLFNKNIIR